MFGLANFDNAIHENLMSNASREAVEALVPRTLHATSDGLKLLLKSHDSCQILVVDTFALPGAAPVRCLDTSGCELLPE